MDMVDEMWLTSLIHKGRMLDSTVVPSQDILRMATKWGARALLDEDLYGSLEVGKDGDIVVVDGDILDSSAFVKLVVLNGEVVVEK